MNLLTWNCAMAFRKKYDQILKHQPDLLVLQECEHKDKLPLDVLKDHGMNDIIWFGNNPHKGVAVISFHDVKIELMEVHDSEYQYILPIQLIYQKQLIHLFAIWAMPHATRSKGYVGQVWQAIHHYAELLDAPSILVGDFNSHPIWDHKYPKGCHSDVVSYLADKNIHSTYHHYHKISHGQEPDPTFFLTKKKDKPYHLDYCFASASLISSQTTVTVGAYDTWISRSDHMPVIVSGLSI